MNDKERQITEMIDNIDESLLHAALKKRFALWMKRGKRSKKPLYSAIAIAACLCILATTLFIFIDRNPVIDPNIPVYQGMTVENSAPSKVASLPMTMPLGAVTNSMNASAAPLTLPQSAAPSFEILPLDGSEKDTDKDKDKENGKDKTPPVFAETYYAMPGEDIYIHIHIQNPAGYEILSFTLNGVKYSSYMFEPGSDLETLILKQNVGTEGGMKEYTIDAIKYVDGEKIKDVRMEGNKTVKVLVSDKGGHLELSAKMDGLELLIETAWAKDFAGEKTVKSLALYEGDTLYQKLSPDATSVSSLPLGKRFVLKATYLDGKDEVTVSNVFTTPPESQGLIISDGVITSIGTCTDTVLYLDHPVRRYAFEDLDHIQKIYMTDNVTSIGESAFYQCSYLEKVVLPTTLKTICNHTFYACQRMTEIEIPIGVTQIENRAFGSCGKLETISIPSTVTYMGKEVFTGCSSLQAIHCEVSKQPEEWSSDWMGNAAVVWGSKIHEHIWKEATCQSRMTCTVCGIQEGTKKPHKLNENSVCTLCGYTLTETNLILQSIMETAPKANIDWGSPIIEIWHENLQLLIIAPYDGISDPNAEAPKDLWFDLYYTPSGEKTDTVTTLQAWSIYPLGGIAIYRIHFYDSLYPDLTVGTDYDISIVMRKGNDIIGWSETSLSWSLSMDNLVKKALQDGIVSCNHIWKDNSCTKICTICGQTSGKATHVWKEATCTSAKTCTRCGITTGTPQHSYDENFVCTLCGHTFTLQNIKETESKIDLSFYKPTVELWQNNLQLLILAPYDGKSGSNVTPPSDLYFDLYLLDKSDSKYTRITLQPWQLYSYGPTAIYRIYFYDTLYPLLTVGNRYSFVIVMRKDNTILGWAERTLLWEKTFDDTVKDAVAANAVLRPDCAHVWQAATCTTPKTCTLCGETTGTPQHSFDENHVCTLCGYKFELPSATNEFVENIMNTAPRKSIGLYFPSDVPPIEIWNDSLHIVFSTFSEPNLPTNLAFDLYYKDNDSSDYGLATLQTWEGTYGFGCLRCQFYDSLYPGMVIGTEYSCVLVLRQGEDIIGWSEITFRWTQACEDIVQQAINDPNIQK